MERLANPASPQLNREEVAYNSDTSSSFFKIESLESGLRPYYKITTTQVLWGLLFGCFICFLMIPILKFLIGVFKFCNKQKRKFIKDVDTPADMTPPLRHDNLKIQ